MTNKNIIVIALFIFLACFCVYLCLLIISKFWNTSSRGDNNEYFEDLFKDPRYEKNRTLLYGSLFLDQLNEQIQKLTDPTILYDNKRIDIIKYNDILL